MNGKYSDSLNGILVTSSVGLKSVNYGQNDSPRDEIEIPNIPLNNWVNVIIRIRDNTMDVYVNGTITRSIKLNGVPKQNYGDVYVAQNGGFQGFISNLWYYNYALGLSDIQTIVMRGPNTKLITPQYASKETDYLSLRWYFFGDGDMYNPTKL